MLKFYGEEVTQDTFLNEMKRRDLPTLKIPKEEYPIPKRVLELKIPKETKPNRPLQFYGESQEDDYLLDKQYRNQNLDDYDWDDEIDPDDEKADLGYPEPEVPAVQRYADVETLQPFLLDSVDAPGCVFDYNLYRIPAISTTLKLKTKVGEYDKMKILGVDERIIDDRLIPDVYILGNQIDNPNTIYYVVEGLNYEKIAREYQHKVKSSIYDYHFNPDNYMVDIDILLKKRQDNYFSVTGGVTCKRLKVRADTFQCYIGTRYFAVIPSKENLKQFRHDYYMD